MHWSRPQIHYTLLGLKWLATHSIRFDQKQLKKSTNVTEACGGRPGTKNDLYAVLLQVSKWNAKHNQTSLFVSFNVTQQNVC